MISIPLKGIGTLNKFGTALKRLRNELGKSQAALAADIGTTQRHVSFLETGRSQPSRTMLARISADLSLGAGQRAALFDASGFQNPYPARDLNSDEVAETLNMIEQRILANWPFPAFVLSDSWDVLRMNGPARSMIGPIVAMYPMETNRNTNLLALLLSDPFRALIANWEEASAGLYFRLQAAAAHNPDIAAHFTIAKENGCFDHVLRSLTGETTVPIYVPVVIKLPDGTQMRIGSLLGGLGSVHDALVEGFEIELLVPLDAQSETAMRAAFNT